MTLCCIITKSLNIQGEIHLIFDEVIYFKTELKAASASASNDKRHSLLNETMCCGKEMGETSDDTDKERSLLSFSDISSELTS